MADMPSVPMGDDTGSNAVASRSALSSAAQKDGGFRLRQWQSAQRLSSISASLFDRIEAFLAQTGFDKAPWIAVMFACGIMAWFVLKAPWQWASAIGLGVLICIGSVAAWRGHENREHVRQASIAIGLVFAVGVATIWVRSEMVGAAPIERPVVERVQGYILERQDQPSQDRIRLTLAVRDATTARSRKIRVNVPLNATVQGDQTPSEAGIPHLREGAIVRLRVRLMPPASPMLPGAYDFARAAWFKGLSATGSLIGDVELVEPAPDVSGLSSIQRSLATHVRSRVEGPAGTIAAAFASGDRGAIPKADQDAMRDAGLTHLLAISGLHVSAVIAAGYLVSLKLLALFPPLALRVKLPLVAACVGALVGIGYTLLTGAQVPTVRACVAAMLVLGALSLGRDALSFRMVACAAIVVMLLWPESVIGPSFQMSFSAVIAIVALHSSDRVRAFLAPREEPWWQRTSRSTLMLFITGLVIELALMPVVMFHFHRAGVYGAFANVIAIPLVTFLAMPLIALALVLDVVGLGAPAWWLVEMSLDGLLSIAHFTSSQPGAVKLMPQMSLVTIAFFVAGGLWLALWSGRVRLLAFVPIAFATGMMAVTSIPDVLIGREGRHVGITVDQPDGSRALLSLRDSRSSYSRDNLLELSSVTSDPIPLSEWQGAQCSPEFCLILIERGERQWSLLLARNRHLIEERALAAACDEADIVVADRFLPRSCKPKWLKADRRFLEKNGGLALNLEDEIITTVASSQGAHGWWQGRQTQR